MKLAEIQLRDPFVLPVEKTGTYYLFGSTDPNIWAGQGIGFDCYRSCGLEDWEGPFPAFRPPEGFWATTNFWAPEVHAFGGRYFLFATFRNPDLPRGTQILVADNPEGPFLPWTEGRVTPPEWACLDGTLHVDAAGDPWIVFCHEWEQIGVGRIVAQRLSSDLRMSVGLPVELFKATEARWTRSLESLGLIPAVGERASFVTDGPFLFRSGDRLGMLWSSFGVKGYAMGLAWSESGTVEGPWSQEPEALWKEDGGHGMLFRTFEGELVMTLHQPNGSPNERAVFRRVEPNGESLRLACHDEKSPYA